jgi:hypothetical protein
MTIETPTPVTAADTIPTDPAGLHEYLARTPSSGRPYVADRLAVQLGGTPDAIARACDLVSSQLADVEHDDQIGRWRARLAAQLQDAATAVRVAQGTLGELLGDLFDVEYAESQAGVDMRDSLDDAARALRVAAAFNPCPPVKNGADR